MKKTTKPKTLTLNTETVRQITAKELPKDSLHQVAGGCPPPESFRCYPY